MSQGRSITLVFALATLTSPSLSHETSWPYKPSVQEPRPLMTVLGFGRPAWDGPNQRTPPLSDLPSRDSISVTATADHVAAETAFRRIGTPATDGRSSSLFAPMSIDVWHGDEQHFGRLGVPQKWINILGRVTRGDGIDAVRYSLNGGAPVRVSLGPDGHRLARDGDFNLDIEFDTLRDGANTLLITATDSLGRRAERTVAVHCHRGNTWPLPYAVDFRKVRSISEVVQIVDGNWQLGPDGVRTVEPYYDRILAFGDRTWTDYTVTVAVTFHNYAPPRGGAPTYGVSHAALAARYPGHFADNKQPHVQWYPVGAVAEFRLGADLAQSTWRIFHGGSATKTPQRAIEPQPRRVELGVKYQLKLRVDSLPGPAARYRVKSWKAAAPEPAAWDLETIEDRNVIAGGGALFVSHNTDVTVGTLTVTANDPQEL